MKFKKYLNRWGLLLVLSIVYILNPSLGIFEILPDNLPFIGNIDEFFATMIILKSMVELGLISSETSNKLLSIKKGKMPEK